MKIPVDVFEGHSKKEFYSSKCSVVLAIAKVTMELLSFFRYFY